MEVFHAGDVMRNTRINMIRASEMHVIFRLKITTNHLESLSYRIECVDLSTSLSEY